MNKICPKCSKVYNSNDLEYDLGFCICGSRLVDDLADVEKETVFNLGDANAISGGVNIDRSKNITSHDTHYHSTTVHERAKSESELKLDATNQLRNKAEEILSERGRIDSIAMGQLRPLAAQLGVDEETFKTIIKDVRSNRNGAASGLSTVNARYLLQAQQAVQTNDMDGLSNLTPRLEAMAAISQDDNVQYLYYLTLSLLYPIKSMEVYERQTDENYWRSFWAIISYVRTGKFVEATKLLTSFEPLRFEKSDEDVNLLEAYSNIMQENKDGAQEFLDDILGEPSEQIKPLHRAIEVALYEEDPDSLEVRFYFERVLSKSDAVIKSAKKAESSTAAPSVEKEEAQPASVEKATKKASKSVAEKPQPKTENNPQAEAMYAEACLASGPKRVMLLQKAAEEGSFDAMYDLSDCYYDGDGVEKNMSLAVKWLTKAAESGMVKAQAALGGVYFQGEEGLDQNYALAEKYLLKAAERDFSKAQIALAYLYAAMEDYEKTLVWARKAADLETEAYAILGRLYSEGLGVEQNYTEALKYYEKAAKEGDADSQNIVGNLYSDGTYAKQDLTKAFKYYQMAAAQGHMYGMYNFGLCYASGDGCLVDMGCALEWIEKAASAGCTEAKGWLDNNSNFATTFDENEVDLSSQEPLDEYDEILRADTIYDNKDASKADECVKIYRKHANDGIHDAQYGLALCYHNGFGVKQNYQLAATWYKKAADQGHALAQLALGLKYEQGHGCAVNYQEAAKWYRKAAEQGVEEAQYRLGLFYLSGDGVVANLQKGVDLITKSAEQNFADAVNWMKNKDKHLAKLSEPGIKMTKVWVDTDGVGQLIIHCDWEATNIKGKMLQFRCNIAAKSGKKIKYDASVGQYYYLVDVISVYTDPQKFFNTCAVIPEPDFNMSSGERKNVEFSIDFVQWGTEKKIYSSKKMKFSVWYERNFFSKNDFSVISQQCSL